jgi:hypothetical protein
LLWLFYGGDRHASTVCSQRTVLNGRGREAGGFAVFEHRRSRDIEAAKSPVNTSRKSTLRLRLSRETMREGHELYNDYNTRHQKIQVFEIYCKNYHRYGHQYGTVTIFVRRSGTVTSSSTAVRQRTWSIFIDYEDEHHHQPKYGRHKFYG